MSTEEVKDRCEIGLAFCRGEVVEYQNISITSQKWLQAGLEDIQKGLLSNHCLWRIKPKPKTRWVVKRLEGLSSPVKEAAFDNQHEAEQFAEDCGYEPPVEYVEVVK